MIRYYQYCKLNLNKINKLKRIISLAHRSSLKIRNWLHRNNIQLISNMKIKKQNQNKQKSLKNARRINKSMFDLICCFYFFPIMHKFSDQVLWAMFNLNWSNFGETHCFDFPPNSIIKRGKKRSKKKYIIFFATYRLGDHEFVPHPKTWKTEALMLFQL